MKEKTEKGHRTIIRLMIVQVPSFYVGFTLGG